jgi:hypothetical protein
VPAASRMHGHIGMRANRCHSSVCVAGYRIAFEAPVLIVNVSDDALDGEATYQGPPETGPRISINPMERAARRSDASALRLIARR